MGWVIFAALLLLNSLGGAAIAGTMILRDIRKPGSTPLKWLFAALALWTLAYAMITLSPTFEAKRFWLRIENVGIVFTPPIWFLFTLSYTRRTQRVNKFFFGLVFLIPIISLVLIFSETWIELYYSGIRIVDGIFSPLDVDGTKWYYVQLVHSYGLLIAGLFILIHYLIVFRDVYRRRTLTLITAFLVPVLLNLFYHWGGMFFENTISVDLSPVSLTITASLLSFAIFNQKLFETAPIASHTVLDHIVEMVFVVDEESHILDANQAAADWLERSIDELIGDDVATAFAAYPKIADYYYNSVSDEQDFHLFTSPDYLEMTLSPIRDKHGSLSGHVLVFHDISDERQMESELKKANKALKAKLVEIEKLQEQLREQAIRDPLTGLYNRRYLTEALEHDISRAERENHKLSIIMMDVDHFKAFNDKYGHKCGDQVLEYLGRMLLLNTRRGDTVCRYGGEEFVIVMPKVDAEVAYARANHWREKFAESVIEYEGQQLRAQLSAGVACYPAGVENSADLLKVADDALYYSKAHGRNCVTVFPLDVEHEVNND